MSTLAYAALTGKRYHAEPGTSIATSPPGLGTHIDAVAALVPAEVLAAHAVFLGFTTATTSSSNPPITTITQVGALQSAFWGLIALSIIIYVGGRLALGSSGRTALDWARLPIPALAFVAWTMLQKTTAFAAVWPSLSEAPRDVISVHDRKSTRLNSSHANNPYAVFCLD